MKLVMGLGNPGRQYEATRHNVGWWLLDRLASRWSFASWHNDMDAKVCSGTVKGVPVRLAKPLTYMNLSGVALRPYLRRPSFSVADDLLVVVDEVALPLGTFRIRAEGSAGGHNGLKSIEQAAGTQGYPRLRIGIRPENEESVRQLSNFVLSPLSRREQTALDELAPQLEAAVESWISEGIGPAMNTYNRKSPPTE